MKEFTMPEIEVQQMATEEVMAGKYPGSGDWIEE